MRKAIHFGAGNIGRGFIGPVLQDNNYEVIFVDVDERLIDKLNTSKEYKVFNLRFCFCLLIFQLLFFQFRYSDFVLFCSKFIKFVFSETSSCWY